MSKNFLRVPTLRVIYGIYHGSFVATVHPFSLPISGICFNLKKDDLSCTFIQLQFPGEEFDTGREAGSECGDCKWVHRAYFSLTLGKRAEPVKNSTRYRLDVLGVSSMRARGHHRGLSPRMETLLSGSDSPKRGWIG